MHTDEVINLLKEPLRLSDNAQIHTFSGGMINHSFYLIDGLNEFMVKHFQGESSLGLDRQERFDLQFKLSKKGLAPEPLFLSSDQLIYAEQWVKQDRSPANFFLNDAHINALAEALTRIHLSKIRANRINLPRDWQNYALSLPSSSKFLVEQVIRTSERWVISNQDDAKNQVFCHNDLAWDHLCLPTKIILDWEYAGIGNRYFDVLSSARVNRLDPRQKDVLLAGYAKLNNMSVNEVYEGCNKQASFLELTYQLWHQSLKLKPTI